MLYVKRECVKCKRMQRAHAIFGCPSAASPQTQPSNTMPNLNLVFFFLTTPQHKQTDSLINKQKITSYSSPAALRAPYPIPFLLPLTSAPKPFASAGRSPIMETWPLSVLTLPPLASE